MGSRDVTKFRKLFVALCIFVIIINIAAAILNASLGNWGLFAINIICIIYVMMVMVRCLKRVKQPKMEGRVYRNRFS